MGPIDTSDGYLATLDDEELFDLMETWFRRGYEDPAMRTPYESAEGGYIWIWGGPYNAYEVLEEEFGGKVSEELIESVVSELERECHDWAPTPNPNDYDDYVIDDISSISQFYHNFSSAILDIEKLLETDIHPVVESNFYRLLYLNVIVAMETYLSDAFIRTVMTEEKFFIKYVESNPDFQQRKISLSEIYKQFNQIKEFANQHLLEVSWHNISRVSKMYESTLGVGFPEDLGDIYRAVLIRHDIVHRNGRDKEGNDIWVFKKDIEALINTVESFIQAIDQALPRGTL